MLRPAAAATQQRTTARGVVASPAASLWSVPLPPDALPQGLTPLVLCGPSRLMPCSHLLQGLRAVGRQGPGGDPGRRRPHRHRHDVPAGGLAGQRRRHAYRAPGPRLQAGLCAACSDPSKHCRRCSTGKRRHTMVANPPRDVDLQRIISCSGHADRSARHEAVRDASAQCWHAWETARMHLAAVSRLLGAALQECVARCVQGRGAGRGAVHACAPGGRRGGPGAGGGGGSAVRVHANKLSAGNFIKQAVSSKAFMPLSEAVRAHVHCYHVA
jgi:hypothetical protein